MIYYINIDMTLGQLKANSARQGLLVVTELPSDILETRVIC